MSCIQTQIYQPSAGFRLARAIILGDLSCKIAPFLDLHLLDLNDEARYMGSADELLEGQSDKAEMLTRSEYLKRNEIGTAFMQIQASPCWAALNLRLLSWQLRYSESLTQLEKVSLNLPAELVSPHNWPDIEQLLKNYEQPERIILELTETSRISPFQTLASSLEDLRERGFEFALDDLGCGFHDATRHQDYLEHLQKIFKFKIVKIGFDLARRYYSYATLIRTNMILARKPLSGIEVQHPPGCNSYVS